jgi:hypothetical protein
MIKKEFLESELKYRYPQMQSRIQRPFDEVGRPLFLESGDKRAGARIFLCMDTHPPVPGTAINPGALFLYIGKPVQPPTISHDYCIFPKETGRLTLFNFIQRLFDRLDEWNQKLKGIAEGASRLPNLLEAAAGMLQNPVWVCDGGGHIVARAERFFTDLDDEAAQTSYKLKDLLPAELQEGKCVRIRKDGITETLCVKLLAAEAEYTLLCCARERSFYGSDETVFGYLSGYVKLMLSERKISLRALRVNRRNDEIERHLRVLLDPASVHEEATVALSKLGWGENMLCTVCAVETVSGDMRYGLVNNLCDRMEESVEHCCAFYFGAVLVAVVGVMDEENVQLSALASFCRKETLRIGRAEPSKGLMYLKELLTQAKYALSAARTHGEASIAFSDIADNYIMKKSTEEFPKRLICSRPAIEMSEYDRQHGTNYLETALRYIENRYNAVQTANDLFIHRSTFLYRLERMKAQFGVDWESGEVLSIRFLLSLRMLVTGD